MYLLQKCPSCSHKQKLTYNKCHGKIRIKGQKISCKYDLKTGRDNQRVSFYLAYRVNGRQVRDYVGKKITEAEDALDDLKEQKRHGYHILSPEDLNVTFEQLTEKYLNRDAVKGLAMYKSGVLKPLFNRFNAAFGQSLVNRIKTSEINDFKARLKEEGLSDAYIDKIIAAPRAMVNAYFKDGELTRHPVDTFASIKKSLKKNANARKQIWTREQFEALMAEAAEHLKPVLAMAYYTGMRRGEILELRHKHVDLINRQIRLTPQMTKDDEPREIPILEPLYQILKDLPASDDPEAIFLTNAGMPLKDFYDGLKSACRRAGIVYGQNVPNGLTFHDLRHSFVTYARRAGVPDKLIMQMTGHSTYEMFQRYNTILPDEVAEFENRMMSVMVR